MQSVKTLEAIRNPVCGWRYIASATDFLKIPNSPIAYWLSDALAKVYEQACTIADVAQAKVGLQTGENERFLRFWHEVDFHTICFGAHSRQKALEKRGKWFPHSKGGSFRRWYGNNEYVVNWYNDGEEVRKYGTEDGGRQKSYPRNMDSYFKAGITWSDLTVSSFAGRYVPPGHIFDTTGPTMFVHDSQLLMPMLGYINSKVFQQFLDISLQGMHYSNGVIAKMPCDIQVSAKRRC